MREARQDRRAARGIGDQAFDALERQVRVVFVGDFKNERRRSEIVIVRERRYQRREFVLRKIMREHAKRGALHIRVAIFERLRHRFERLRSPAVLQRKERRQPEFRIGIFQDLEQLRRGGGFQHGEALGVLVGFLAAHHIRDHRRHGLIDLLGRALKTDVAFRNLGGLALGRCRVAEHNRTVL